MKNQNPKNDAAHYLHVVCKIDPEFIEIKQTTTTVTHFMLPFFDAAFVC
jgi:hypothetical protein